MVVTGYPKLHNILYFKISIFVQQHHVQFYTSGRLQFYQMSAQFGSLLMSTCAGVFAGQFHYGLLVNLIK